VNDKIFTNGPVQVSFVARAPEAGNAIITKIGDDSSSIHCLCIGKSMNTIFRVSSGYYFKSIEFVGAAGDIRPLDIAGFSTVNNIWKTDSTNITEITFGNFFNPAYITQFRIHVVNTGSGQAVDQSPERAYLEPLGQTSNAAFFRLTYNDYLKQRCTQSQKSVILMKETSSSKNGPWTRSNISADDAYDYKFIDDFGGEFLEYEMLGSGHWVRYVVLRDSAWYDGYDIVLATTEAKYVPA